MGYHRNDGHNAKLQVLIQPNIGLENDVRQAVVEILNTTLADEVVLAAKTCNACWNVRGADFFKLYTLLKLQSKTLNAISGAIARRARMMGGFAIGSLEEFLNHTRLEEHPGVVPDVLRLLADHEAAIRFLREDSKKCTEEYEDEGTFELLVSVMRQHEKMAWMLRSHVESEPVPDESQKRIFKDE